MRESQLFFLLKELVGTVPNEEVISFSAREVAKQYFGITLSPKFHANGSVPKEVRRSPEIIPERHLTLRMYQVFDRATSLQIYEFQKMHNSIHLGALGLVLMRKLLPIGVRFLAFEDNARSRISVLINHGDDTYQLGVVKLDDIDFWDDRYGFVCSIPDPTEELLSGYN